MSEPTEYGAFAHRNDHDTDNDERTDRIRRFRSVEWIGGPRHVSRETLR